MKYLFWIIYELAVRIFGIGIKIHAVWSGKSSARLKGLKNWQSNLGQLESPMLFHVASLGEFEQARPVIEKIKEISPSKQLVLTFFSSSGYEIRKNYDHADKVLYLPLDTLKNMQVFISQINPSAIVFTKYDLWFNLIRSAQAKAIPCYLISSLFRSNHIYLRCYMFPLTRCLRSFKQIFTQDYGSVEILEKHGFLNMTYAGDTRVDRVLKIQDGTFDDSRIRHFAQGRKALIVGSSWHRDEKIILPSIPYLIERGWCIVLAPHETNKARIEQLSSHLNQNFALYSQIDVNQNDQYDVLIVDTIGDLSHLYRFGDIAFIGGGFDNGIHNTLEPAAARLPIIFGPKFHKFEEARIMVDLKLAVSIRNKEEYREALNLFMDESTNSKVKTSLEFMITDRAGATESIINKLKSDKII